MRVDSLAPLLSEKEQINDPLITANPPNEVDAETQFDQNRFPMPLVRNSALICEALLELFLNHSSDMSFSSGNLPCKFLRC